MAASKPSQSIMTILRTSSGLKRGKNKTFLNARHLSCHALRHQTSIRGWKMLKHYSYFTSE